MVFSIFQDIRGEISQVEKPINESEDSGQPSEFPTHQMEQEVIEIYERVNKFLEHKGLFK